MKVEVDIALTPQQLAELFCDMNDEAQAVFLGDVAQIMSRWAPHARDLQIAGIGGHLTCECAGGARYLIVGIHESMLDALDKAAAKAGRP